MGEESGNIFLFIAIYQIIAITRDTDVPLKIWITQIKVMDDIL